MPTQNKALYTVPVRMVQLGRLPIALQVPSDQEPRSGTCTRILKNICGLGGYEVVSQTTTF